MRTPRPLGVPLRQLSWLVLLGATIVAACGGSGASPSPPAALRVDQAATGTTVTVAPGQMLVIALPTNPSTGFGWEVLFPPDPAVLASVAEPEFTMAPEGGAPVVGAGGTTLLRLAAVAPGETGLTLVYQRPWERDPADRFELAIVVR